MALYGQLRYHVILGTHSGCNIRDNHFDAFPLNLKYTLNALSFVTSVGEQEMRVYIDQTTFPSFITLTLTLISSLLLLLTRSHSLSLLPLISISLTLSLVAKASTILYPVEYTSTPTLAPVSHSTHRHSFTRFNPPPNQSNSIFSSLSQTTTTHTSTRLYYHNVVPNHSRATPLGFRRRWISARTSSCQTRSTR